MNINKLPFNTVKDLLRNLVESKELGNIPWWIRNEETKRICDDLIESCGWAVDEYNAIFDVYIEELYQHEMKGLQHRRSEMILKGK